MPGVLAVIVGAFHTCLYVLIRGSAGARVPFVFLAAILGAYAGYAIGARLDAEFLARDHADRDCQHFGAYAPAGVGAGIPFVQN